MIVQWGFIAYCSVVVLRHPVGNSEQPGGKGGQVAAVARSVPPRLFKGLRGQVFRYRAIPDPIAEIVVNARQLETIQLFKARDAHRCTEPCNQEIPGNHFNTLCGRAERVLQKTCLNCIHPLAKIFPKELYIENCVVNVLVFSWSNLYKHSKLHSPEIKMPTAVRELNQHFIDVWWEGNTDFPDLGSLYTVQAQTQNEKSLLQFVDQVEHVLSNPPRSREEAQSAKLRLGLAFRCLAEETLDLPGSQLDLLPSESFSNVAEEFVRKARAFDSRLSMDDIYQAERNAWTAHGLQWLLGLTVQLSPSIFAYSMLYPYTDNYLDDPGITSAAKRAFNERLGRRLRGDLLSPVNVQEHVIFKLVEMIEKQYSQIDHPDVFESLLAIHDAQSQSLNLLRQTAAPGEVDVLGLCFYKGGTSVMADGYLAGGSLTEAQRQYTYGHGVLAQLLDDLEDVEQDGKAARLTIYSQPAGHWPLDRLANRTFKFGQRTLMALDCFEVDETVRGLIRRGANLLLIDAIGRTDNYYSPSYLRELEAHFPFRFSFLKEKRKEFMRRHGSLGKLVELFLPYGKF
jgi:hypothetical protein